MNLLHLDAPVWLTVSGWLVTIAACGWAALAVRRAFLPSSAVQHAWFAAIVTVCLLWSLHVRSPIGLDFSVLGSALVALIFGRARAMLALVVALAMYTLVESGSWQNFGVNAVAMAVFPVWLATSLQSVVVNRLPRNVFVFIIGNGLFVTLLATAATDLLMLALGALETAASARPPTDHIAYTLLLAWGEALISGMLFSALVLFRPEAVLTYPLDLYLPPRRTMQ